MKRSFQATRTDQLPVMLPQAFGAMLSGRPGVAARRAGHAAAELGIRGDGGSASPACGARLAAPSRAVAAVVGDGGFPMLPSAVATAVQYGLPAIWLVWNNRGFISIRDQQRGYFGQELATSLRYAASGTPYRCDSAAMARAMGADGLRPRRVPTSGAALKTALDSGVSRPGFGWPDP